MSPLARFSIEPRWYSVYIYRNIAHKYLKFMIIKNINIYTAPAVPINCYRSARIFFKYSLFVFHGKKNIIELQNNMQMNV